MARAENHLRLNPLVLGPYNSVVHYAKLNTLYSNVLIRN